MPTELQQLLHITHAHQDEAWVERVLVPALGLTDDQYWTRAEADPAALKLEELEHAVKACRYTLLVVSGAARVDQWVQFAARLAQHLGLEEGKPRLLLVTRQSERARELLPLGQRCLVCLDCSDPERTTAALATLAAQLAVTTTEEPPAECPYPGLRMFGEGGFNRPDLFFGRDEEGHAIVEQLRGGGRVLLVGPSGCGKSSLVRARVLPALGHGPDAMVIAVARPGAHPDVELRKALDALDPRLGPATDAYLGADDQQAALAAFLAAAAGPKRLLYLDQLEEVFLDDTDERGERARFFARLAALDRVPGLAILLGMRADFYGDLMRSSVWDDFKDHRVELAPLRGAALRLAITRPAEAVGVHVEADLVERLVREADLDRAAEALPLLQVALEELWTLREWRYLSLASYARLADGERRGLDVVLARHADDSIGKLAEPAQVLARRVLIDLVHLGEGRPDTRRRRTERELRRAGDAGDALTQVLDHLSARRLIVVGGEAQTTAAVQAVALPPSADEPEVAERYIDLAHDTLTTGWPALAGWIAKRRDDLRTQRRLEARAAGGGLLAASELPELTRWVAWIATPAGQALGATEALRKLVRRSVAARRTRHMTLGVVLVALIAILAVAAGVSLWQRGIALDNAEQATANATEANQQRKQTDVEKVTNKRLLVRSAQTYQETGRQLLLEGRAFESIPYLLEARIAGGAGAPLRMLFSAASRHVSAQLLEHKGSVRSAAFSPDGTRIVTASDDHTARIWDATTGKPLSQPFEHKKGVISAAFSPDGTRVVTASKDQTARIWDAVTGKPLAVPLEHVGYVNSAAFSPDGTRVVTVSGTYKVRVWDAATGKPLFAPLQHQGVVYGAAFSPDGIRIVTASADSTARIWDAATGKPLARPLEHQYGVVGAAFSPGVVGAAFSPDGTRVITVSRDDTVRVWNAATGKPLVASFKQHGNVTSAAFSLDGTRVATGSNDDSARVWNATTGKPLSAILRHQASVLGVAFSSDGTRVVTASEDNTARVWDAATGKPLSVPLEHLDEVNSAAFSPDGTRVVTASADHTARVWGATSKPLATSFEHQDKVWNAAFSSDGTRVITASADKTARIWDAATGRPLATPLEHNGTVYSAAFSSDGTRVVTASTDHTARVWDAATGNPLAKPLEHLELVRSAAFSPDGTRIVTSSKDKTARVWDAATGKLLATFLEHQEFVGGAAFSPDGTHVITASADNTARIWDAATGRPLATPLEHKSAVNSVAFSPDGTRVVTASADNTARIWDAATSKPLAKPLEHLELVSSAAFSPDGTRVVTASADNTARIWDAATGNPLFPPFKHQDRVWSAVFSPDGTRVVTASFDNTARVWDAVTGKPLTMPLEHQKPVPSAAFSPDGTRVVTASFDNTARVWAISLDRGTPADWEAVATRTPYVLVNGVLSPRGSFAPASLK